MSNCIIPKLEWGSVGDCEIKEHAPTDDVRKTFCQCLDTILLEFLKYAVIDADDRSESRHLTLRHANCASRKVPELQFE